MPSSPGSVEDRAVILEMRGVVKSYGGPPVVRDVFLAVREGEFFSILGPSGAGKTTLLRLLAGFEQPDQGEILLDGRPMAGVPPSLRPVNTVFQSYALFPHMTAEENIGFGPLMQGLPKDERRRRVDELTHILRLDGLRDRRPAQLSGGEQQRVALARALVNRPAVLLLDEPMAALDEQLRQSMTAELKRIQQRVGITFICVTHHQAEALALSDRLAVMEQGRVVQIGPPEEVYKAPACRFVAEFLGRSNILTGRVRLVGPDRGELVVPRLNLAVSIPSRELVRLSDGQEATLVLRSELVLVENEGPRGEGETEVPVVVDQVDYAGTHWRYRLRLDEGLFWHAMVPNGNGRKRLSVGDRGYAWWHRDDGFLLPNDG
jgi:spermidine/putrescine transport system ATP-binding protein